MCNTVSNPGYLLELYIHVYMCLIDSELKTKAMEIIRGSLDDISRPASSERAGSRVRPRPTAPFELVVLTSDSAGVQKQSCPIESTTKSSSTGYDKDPSHSELTEDESEDAELQKAFEEMRRLDELLAAETNKLKELCHQRKDLQAKLWQELKKETEKHSECALEAKNTKLFLALEAPPTGAAKEENFVPLFETQVPDCELDGAKDINQSHKRSDGLTESFKRTNKDVGEKQLKGSKSSKIKHEQKDFIKRNIELVSGEVGQMHLTPAEKQRLAELLQELDEEEEDSAKGTDSEAMWTASVLTGQGYTPEPPDLEQLIEIGSKIRPFLPDEEISSLQSSYASMSMFQGLGSKVGWKCDGDQQPGEKALQDIKERREQETRLQEIQEQLENLGLSQETTNESPRLTEEQLLHPLDACELTVLERRPSE